MKIMVLGHDGHGKTTAAKILSEVLKVNFRDTTAAVVEIACNYAAKNEKAFQEAVKSNPDIAQNTKKYFTTGNITSENVRLAGIIDMYKDSFRPFMYEAVADYCKTDPAKFIKKMFVHSDIYAGCRSSVEYEAAKHLIDLTIWVENKNLPNTSAKMYIEYDSNTMYKLSTSGTVAALEKNIKKLLSMLTGLPASTYDDSWRDSLITNLPPRRL